MRRYCAALGRPGGPSLPLRMSVNKILAELEDKLRMHEGMVKRWRRAPAVVEYHAGEVARLRKRIETEFPGQETGDRRQETESGRDCLPAGDRE